MCGWSFPFLDDAGENFEVMADELRAPMADGVNESICAGSARNPGAGGLVASYFPAVSAITTTPTVSLRVREVIGPAQAHIAKG
jgi:hypothetical protein